MTKRIPAMTAHKKFGELLEGVFYKGDEVIVERAGKPMGVLIPMRQYQIRQYQKLECQRSDAEAKMEQLWASVPTVPDQETAEREILEETEAVRHGSQGSIRATALVLVGDHTR